MVVEMTKAGCWPFFAYSVMDGLYFVGTMGYKIRRTYFTING